MKRSYARQLIVGSLFALSSVIVAGEKFLPIVQDDTVTVIPYMLNHMPVPLPAYENEFNVLSVQCEKDIAYFIYAYKFYDEGNVTVDNGEVVVEEDKLTDDEFRYIRGYVEGNQTVSITASVYTDGELRASDTKTCHSKSHLKVPTFNGNSQGKLVYQCENDVVYYIMAYDCLRGDTKPSVTATGGNLIVDQELVHEGEVFYTKGHIERTGGPVEITGHVYSGGHDLDQTWTGRCE